MQQEKLKVGNSIWVSRFSPNEFELFETHLNEENGYAQPTKDTIFIRPYRAVITQFYPITRKRDKWVLLLEPIPNKSVTSLTASLPQMLFSLDKINWSLNPWENQKQFVSAALLDQQPNYLNPLKGSTGVSGKSDKYFQKIQLEVQVKNGKIVTVSNNYIISVKRIQNFKTNQQVLRKFLKIAKKNHKYNQMNMLTSCLLDVHTASQSKKMICNNPENFI